MRKYQVDNIKFGFKYHFDDYFMNNIETYEIDGNTTVNHEIHVYLKDDIIMPKGKVLGSKNPFTILNDNERIFFTKTGNTVRAKMSHDYKYKKIKIELNKSELENLGFYEYVFSGIMFLELAQYLSYLPLHATAINIDNEVILFSAPSGTGKSTHRRYWTEVYPNVEIINDDKPLLSFEDNNIFVHGSPFSGEEHINVNKKVKLKAIVFLKQGTTNNIRRLSKDEKINELIRNTVTPKLDYLWDRVLLQIEQIINKVPIVELDATNNYNAVEAIYKYFYGGNKKWKLKQVMKLKKLVIAI